MVKIEIAPGRPPPTSLAGNGGVGSLAAHCSSQGSAAEPPPHHPSHRGYGRSIDASLEAGKRAWDALLHKITPGRPPFHPRHPLAAADQHSRSSEFFDDEWNEERVQYGLDASEGPMPSRLVDIPSTRCCDKPRRKLIRSLDSVLCQITLLLLILLDVSLTIYQISADASDPDRDEPQWMFALTLIIVSILLIEVSLRLFGLGVRHFFRHWYNTLDLVVSVASLILEVVVYVAHQRNKDRADGGDASAASNLSLLRVLRPAARVIRCLRFGTRAYRQHQHMQAAARLVVGGNKRRFNEDGFDLDLCYVHDHLIGMSVPAVGGMSLYRNPIDEVARFFRERHPDSFMIYNCTSECSYPSEPFHGHVRRVAIDDHNVPTLETMVGFCRDLEDQSRNQPEIVFALHCRGGKGRTGLMICAWLLWSRHCRTADEALDLWAKRRTDETIRGKTQGVQTMSQVRYVRYMEQLLSSGRPLSRRPRALKHIVVRQLLPDSNDVPDGCLPWVVLTQVGKHGTVLLDTKPAAGSVHRPCGTQHGTDLYIDLLGYHVSGDVKIELFVEKGVGDDYLKREAQAVDSAALLGAPGARGGRGGASRKGSRKSVLPETIQHATQSLKNAANVVNPNAIFGAQGIEGAPPVPGGDRQLVLYTWFHIEMEPGGERVVELPATQLDKGSKGIFKKLTQRGVSLEVEFDDAGVPMRQATVSGASCVAAASMASQAGATPAPPPADAAATSAPNAALERARLAASNSKTARCASLKARAGDEGDSAVAVQRATGEASVADAAPISEEGVSLEPLPAKHARFGPQLMIGDDE